MAGDDRRVLVYEKLRPGTQIVTALQGQGLEPVLPFGAESCLLRHHPISAEAFIDLAHGYPAVLGVSGARLNRAVLNALPGLRFISKIGIGHEVIDLTAATELCIQVTNTPSAVEIDGVAEHAIALMLAAAKRLDFYTLSRMRQGQWLDPGISPQLLRGRTVGLVGFGRIARAVAARLQGWQVTVIASDLPGTAQGGSVGVSIVELTQLLSESDIISVHASTNAGEPPVLDRDAIARIKRGAILVNTSRGQVVDQHALSEALADGKLLAAAVDVFNPEPPPRHHPLLMQDNVITTPHMSAASHEAEEDMEQMAVDNLVQLFGGSAPDALLNPLARGVAESAQAQRREQEAR